MAEQEDALEKAAAEYREAALDAALASARGRVDAREAERAEVWNRLLEAKKRVCDLAGEGAT